MTVDDDVAKAVLPDQPVVVLRFHAGFSDHVARLVEFVARIVEHLLRDFADVSDHVRHESVFRIEAPVDHDGVEITQLVAVRFDERQLVRRDVIFQHHRLRRRLRRESPDARPYFLRGNVQPGGDLLDVRRIRLQLLAQEQHRERRIVVHDDAAFAVEYLAARRQDGHLADAVLLRQRLVLIAARDLQTRKPHRQHDEDHQDRVLHERQFYGWDFFAISVPLGASGRHTANGLVPG